MAFEIKDPPEFTTDVEQWTRETDADGAQMAKVIEKLLNNEVFLKGLIEKLDGNAVKAGDKGIPEGVASLGADGKLEQRVDYDKIDDVPAPAWGNITGKPSNYSPSSHTHAKSEVGLGNVDNTADARKSVSYAANAGDADTVDGKHASAFAASSHTHSAATQSAAGLMSANDKKKLDGVATGANAYSHPTGNGNNHIPSGGASGQILRWSAAGTATWGSDNNTTYSAATQSAQGLMSAADKKKLDGITAGANMLKSDIVNNCTSTNTDKPLAANQGKVLMEKFNQLNSDLAWEAVTFTKSSTYISGGDGFGYRMGQVCICSFAVKIKSTIPAWSNVVIGRVSRQSHMSCSAIANLQSSGKTVQIYIDNGSGSSGGYDVHLETFNQEVPADDWLRGFLIYFH